MNVIPTTEHRAIDFNASQLAEIVTRCFEGYIMPFVLDAGTFERRFRPEGLDSQASVVLMADDQPAGICLIARQGWTSRVAAMAIAPDFRSKGIGKKLMTLVIEEAKERGDRQMVLEVIEQNPPAIGLYESVGMAQTRRLVGWRREPSDGIQGELQTIDPAEVVRRQVTECDANLPWDFKPETLMLKIKTIGITLDNKAFALISDTPERLIIWTLFTNRKDRRQGHGRTLINALAAKYPGKPIITPVALPDDHEAEFLAAMEFKNPEISQFEMAISFAQ